MKRYIYFLAFLFTSLKAQSSLETGPFYCASYKDSEKFFDFWGTKLSYKVGNLKGFHIESEHKIAGCPAHIVEIIGASVYPSLDHTFLLNYAIPKDPWTITPKIGRRGSCAYSKDALMLEKEGWMFNSLHALLGSSVAYSSNAYNLEISYFHLFPLFECLLLTPVGENAEKSYEERYLIPIHRHSFLINTKATCQIKNWLKFSCNFELQSRFNVELFRFSCSGNLGFTF